MLATIVRSRAIALAQEQWNDYLEYSQLPPEHVDSLLDRTSHDHPNDCIKGFLRFAAQLRGAVRAVVARDTLSAVDCHAKAISWLACVPSKSGALFVTLKLDMGRLQGRNHESVPGASVHHLGRIVRATCLHEIGHLFLHWEYILEGHSGIARWAKPPQEAEAWSFAFSVLSMAAESFAVSFIEDPDHRRHVWELMRDAYL